MEDTKCLPDLNALTKYASGNGVEFTGPRTDYGCRPDECISSVAFGSIQVDDIGENRIVEIDTTTDCHNPSIRLGLFANSGEFNILDTPLHV
jgi:hypothetical protein